VAANITRVNEPAGAGGARVVFAPMPQQTMFIP